MIKKFVYRLRNFFISPILHQRPIIVKHDNVISQLMLQMAYRDLVQAGRKLPNLNEIGFKVYSQTDEDGILLYIFAIIGTKNKKCVEICAGNGIECNTANLIINHGWTGLLVDGNETLVQQGIEFYKRNPNTYVYPPIFSHSWITSENIDEIFITNGFEGEIDLLSIDMDGVDYWIWNAIKAINPRVVVLEYQDIIGPEKALTVPYKEGFDAYEYPTTKGMPNFCGASLMAFVKLAEKKGYRLVGCNRYGYNAFFVRNDLGEKEIPEIPIIECFRHPKVIWGMRERFPIVENYPWIEV